MKCVYHVVTYTLQLKHVDHKATNNYSTINNMRFLKNYLLTIFGACYLVTLLMTVKHVLHPVHVVHDSTLPSIPVPLSCNVPILDPYDPSILPYIHHRHLTPLCHMHTEWVVVYDDGYLIWNNVCAAFEQLVNCYCFSSTMTQ